MSTRALVTLGIGQCVNWGVLYYAFAILLLPVEQELGLPRWAVAGAFSLSLLVSAMAAPAVGRLGDRGRAPVLIQAGGLAAAAVLGLWALFPGTVTLYLAWAALGLCMACTLYEPAFAIVGRAHADPVARLRGLALVTLCGGLASTAVLPVTGWLVRAYGWRVSVGVLALAMAASAGLTRAATSSLTRATTPPSRLDPSPPPPSGDRPRRVPHLAFLLAAFGFSSLSAAAVIANLVPAAMERHITPTMAAMLGGTFGVMQLPGRALMMRRGIAVSPFRLLAVSLALQALGLLAWGTAPGAVAAVAGLMTFALGSGLGTLVRPFFVQTVLASHGPSYINGRVAQAQQLARAAGPVLVAWVALHLSYAWLLTGLAAVYAGLAAFAFTRPPVEPLAPSAPA